MFNCRGPSIARLAKGVSGLGRRQIQSKSNPHVHFFPFEQASTAEPHVMLSYLSSPPMHPSNIIGWAPLDSTKNDFDLDPVEKFRPNETFLQFLQQTIARLAPEDPYVKSMAAFQNSGWLHIADERNPPPYGRIPLPEDILGSIRVDNKVPISGTYQPMNEAYRVVTTNGVLKLNEFLHQKLLECAKELEKPGA